MTTFALPCYRDDPLHAITPFVTKEFLVSEHVLKICDFEIEPHPGFIPDVPSGNLKGLLMRDPKLIEKIVYKKTSEDPTPLQRLIEENDDWCIGLNGVYQLAASLLNYLDYVKPVSNVDDTFLKQLFLIGTNASQLSPPTFYKAMNQLVPELNKNLQLCEKLIGELYRIPSFGRRSVYRTDTQVASHQDKALPEIEIPRNVLLRQYNQYFYKNIVVLKHDITDRCYLLTRRDLERLEVILRGHGLQAFYFANYHQTDHTTVQRLHKDHYQIRALLRKTMLYSNSRDCNHIGRAYEIAFNYVLAHFAADVNRNSINLQSEKFAKEKYNRFFNLDQFASICLQWEIKEALELASIYRVLPQPDYDHYSMLSKQMELYNNKHEQIPSTEPNENIEGIFKYYKYLLIRAYHKKHGICPGVVNTPTLNHWSFAYPNCDPKYVDYEEIDLIDMNGCFEYVEHTNDIYEFVKDSSICPDGIERIYNQTILNRTEKHEKNMLLNTLEKEYDLRNIEDIDFCLKLDDKAESKKPNGRMFFEARTLPRILLSEYEANLAEYVRYAPACIAGKTKREYLHGVQDASAKRLFYDEYGDNVKPLFVSFDLDKWSPKMPISIHNKLDEINEQLFNSKRIGLCNRIWNEGRLYYVKHKYLYSTDKIPSDFEGFAARKSTLFHAAVMGYAVSRLRRDGVFYHGAKFMTLIDDGLLRVLIKETEFENKSKEVFAYLERIYNMIGIRISWDKTFVSSNLTIFLHEIRYCGRIIPIGCKALAKLQHRGKAASPSILDDLDIIETSVRAIITSGAPPLTAYSIYVYYVLIIIRRYYKPHLFPVIQDNFVLFGFSPHEFGGLAIRSLMTLCGSLEFDEFEAQMGVLKYTALRWPQTTAIIDKIINQPIAQERTSINLEGKIQWRIRNPIFSRYRLRSVVERKFFGLIRNSSVKFLKDLSELGTIADLNLEDEVFVQLPSEIRFLVLSSTIEYAIRKMVNKFLRSTTVTSFLTFRTIKRIGAANASEALKVMRNWNVTLNS